MDINSIQMQNVKCKKGFGVMNSFKYGFLLFFIFHFSFSSFAQQATWIWYPGDYEIWLANKMENRRTDRGTFFPVFWKIDTIDKKAKM